MRDINKKSIGITLLAIVLVIYLLILVDFRQFMQYLHHQIPSVILLTVIYSSIFLLRVFRNYFLFTFNNLFPSKLKIQDYLPIGLIAGVFATYGPMKSGELIAVEMYHENFELKRGNALSVIIVGRIMDIILVLALVGSGIFIISSFNQTLSSYLIIMSLLLAITFITLLFEKVGNYLLQSVEFLFFGKLHILYEKLETLKNEYYSGINLINNLPSFVILLSMTLSRWLLEIYYFNFLLSSFNFGLSMHQILPIIGLIYAIGVSSGTPGGLGTSQLTAVGLLIYYGIEASLAAVPVVITTAISIFCHFLFIIMGYLLLLGGKSSDNQESDSTL